MKKLGIGLYATSFLSILTDVILILIHFLRANTLVSLSTSTCNTMLIVGIICYVTLIFSFLIAVTMRIILTKLNIGLENEKELKEIYNRIIISDIIAITIIALAFYFTYIKKLGEIYLDK